MAGEFVSDRNTDPSKRPLRTQSDLKIKTFVSTVLIDQFSLFST